MRAGAAVAAVLGCVAALTPLAAAGRTSLPTCGPDQVPQAVTAARAGGRVITGTVAVSTWGTSACVLRGRLTFAVTHVAQRIGPHGAIRTIGGNPAVATVDTVLEPGAVLAASWRWRNWCGRDGRFRLQPSFRNWPYLAVPSGRVSPPACSSRAARSTLERVPVRLRRCAAGDLRLASTLGQPFLQNLIGGVKIGLRAHRGACRLVHARLTFALQEQAGGQWVTLQQVLGNPARRLLGALLVPGREPAQAFWAWRNWCGGAGRFRALATVNGHAAAGPSSTDAPTCQDPGARSTLSPSFGHS